MVYCTVFALHIAQYFRVGNSILTKYGDCDSTWRKLVNMGSKIAITKLLDAWLILKNYARFSELMMHSDAVQNEKKIMCALLEKFAQQDWLLGSRISRLICTFLGADSCFQTEYRKKKTLKDGRGRNCQQRDSLRESEMHSCADLRVWSLESGLHRCPCQMHRA